MASLAVVVLMWLFLQFCHFCNFGLFKHAFIPVLVKCEIWTFCLVYYVLQLYIVY